MIKSKSEELNQKNKSIKNIYPVYSLNKLLEKEFFAKRKMQVKMKKKIDS